ncbi:Calx-beta domain-containing protein, partial [Aeromonas sobria]|uniref:Calx-beta domain-containing protein n=1 Tax=Aeromonas sobria TaxID=646 RepID=UPI000C6D12C2
AGDSATQGSDYQGKLYVADGQGYREATAADLKIAAGSTELKLFVKVLDDQLTESRETVSLGASSGSSKLTNAGSTVEASAGIVDDRNTTPGGNPNVDEDTTATLGITAGEDVREANDGYLSYTVKLSNAVSEDVALNLTLGKAGDSATQGSDYQGKLYVADGQGYREATAADLKIAAGSTELKLFVKVLDDQLTESRETVSLGASSGSSKLTNAGSTVEASAGIVDDRNTTPGGNPNVDE